MNRHIATLIAAALMVFVAGCGESLNSSFVYSEQTESLMLEAQDGFHKGDDDLPGAKDLIDERFGNPQSLKAWSKLPVDFGGVTGRVVETPDSKTLILNFDAELPVQTDVPLNLQFVSGPAATIVVKIDKLSSGAWAASLSGNLETLIRAHNDNNQGEDTKSIPIAGDDVVLNDDVKGRVVATPDMKTLTLNFDEEVQVQSGEPLMLEFVTGPAAEIVVEIDKLSEVPPTASLSGNLETLIKAHNDNNQGEETKSVPVAGDVVVLNGGVVLQHGRGLYMRHCSHCHGTSGDGNGPTAQYLVPRPRDYRQGVFKFTSTNDQAKISRDDLHRVLKNGIPGTYMPSFVPMLNEDDKHAVVEYVRLLAMRGEFEKKIGVELSPDFSKAAVTARIEGGESKPEIVESLREFLAEDMADSLEFVSDDLETAWTTADTDGAVITPDMSRVPDSPESRRLGRELYLSKGINCADCHGIAGKGDGPQTTIFEKNPVTQQLYDTPGLHDVWDNVNQPRNLTRGIYRGGRRPIDLFRRIHAGIKGSRMPSFKIVPHEQIWHIVNYVLSIPFEVEPGHAPVVNASAEATPQASL